MKILLFLLFIFVGNLFAVDKNSFCKDNQKASEGCENSWLFGAIKYNNFLRDKKIKDTSFSADVWNDAAYANLKAAIYERAFAHYIIAILFHYDRLSLPIDCNIYFEALAYLDDNELRSILTRLYCDLFPGNCDQKMMNAQIAEWRKEISRKHLPDFLKQNRASRVQSRLKQSEAFELGDEDAN